MNDRITATMLDRKLVAFCAAFGLDPARYFIDGYNPGDRYRCRVAEKLENGGEGEPLGPERYSRRELYDRLHFAIRAAELRNPEVWRDINRALTAHAA